MTAGAARLLLAAAGSALLVGCADEGAVPLSPGGGDDVFYSRDIQPLWDRDCTGCHAAGGVAGLDLSADHSRAGLVGVPSTGYAAVRVAPGDPTASVLYGKLADTGQYGGPMPDGGPAFTAAELELVRRWIVDGARDD
ncbi:MAG: hypothetical protein Q7W29_08290 [bacterium]|nr:hypothetical protein [bacterium]